MRHVGRILALSGVTFGPAVVVLIACNVDNSHLPGLPNELPNHQGIPVLLPTGAGGTGGTSTTTTTTTTQTQPAMSVCDCAEAYTLEGTTACTGCQGTMCETAYTTCQAGDCDNAINCLVACTSGDGACIAACIAANPDYENLMSCLFLQGCASSCGVATPLTCPLPDGGSDAGGD